MIAGTEEIAAKLAELEKLQRELSASVRAASSPEGFLEGALFFPVERTNFSGKVAAVDGGVLGEEFSAADLVVSRAVAVCFEYENGKLKGQQRLPQVSRPEAFAEFGLESFEFNLYKSLVRLELEVSRAREAIEKFAPDFLFLDGAILPLPHDKPSAESAIAEKYSRVVDGYLKLFSLAIEKNCTLAGVVKDSNSRHFLKTIAGQKSGAASRLGEVLGKTNDSSFLHSLLREAERTAAFSFSESENPVLRDFGKIGGKVCGFYAKPSEYDRPLRVDFLLPKGRGEKTGEEIGFVQALASVVHSLSCIHRAYAYPAVLIEADLRAALDPRELEAAKKLAFSKSKFSHSTMQLRRNARPFR